MPLQHRRGYAADLHHGLPTGNITQPESSRHGPQAIPVRAATQPTSARLELVVILRGFQPLVPHVPLSVSLAEPGPSGSTDPPRRCRGLLPALPGVSRMRLPPATTGPLRRPGGEGLPPPLGSRAPRGARSRNTRRGLVSTRSSPAKGARTAGSRAGVLAGQGLPRPAPGASWRPRRAPAQSGSRGRRALRCERSTPAHTSNRSRIAARSGPSGPSTAPPPGRSASRPVRARARQPATRSGPHRAAIRPGASTSPPPRHDHHRSRRPRFAGGAIRGGTGPANQSQRAFPRADAAPPPARSPSPAAARSPPAPPPAPPAGGSHRAAPAPPPPMPPARPALRPDTRSPLWSGPPRTGRPPPAASPAVSTDT